MPRIHVCSWRTLDATVRQTGARDVLTVMRNVGQVETPAPVVPERHLKLDFSDIVAPSDGQKMAELHHIAALLEFVEVWERAHPLVIHCFAGVSRSTASAFISACALRPDQNEAIWAEAIRTASPTAMPNIHLVRLGDQLLRREGRMIRAIEALGPGQPGEEGVPFALDIGPR